MNPATRVMDDVLEENQQADRRSKAPVLVLGCGFSGTKFLYHTLLSAGGSPSIMRRVMLSTCSACRWLCAS